MATPFLGRLKAASESLIGSFESGTPMVEGHVAKQLSPLYSTFGPFLDALPYQRATSSRIAINDSTLRLKQLYGALAGHLGDPSLANTDKKGRELLEAATEQGLMVRTAQDKNTMYRMASTPEAMATWRSIIGDNARALGLGDDADDYLRYISDMNMNANEKGALKVSPNRFMTYEGFMRSRSAYDITNKGEGSVWHRPKGKMRNTIAFDLETSGGPANVAGINEVAAQRVYFGNKGRVSLGAYSARETFSVNRMTLGVFADPLDNKVARTLNLKFGSSADNTFTSVAGDGDEFIRRVTPLLEQMANANSILGQNIMGFDIDRLLGSVIRTSSYQQGGNITKLVGRIQGKMSQGDYVIDTLHMLGEYERSKQVSLGRSPYLPGGQSTRSLENILLNTNLIQYMRDKEVSKGRSLWDEATSSVDGIGGHHTGRYDALVTSALYDALTTDSLKIHQGDEVIGTIPVEDIKRIVSAKAYTPMSTISSPTDILRSSWDNLRERGGARIRSVIPGVADKVLGPKDEISSILKELQQGDRYLDTDITYADQASIHTRNLSKVGTASAEETYNIVARAGDAWRLATGMDTPYEGTLNAGGSVFKHGTGFDLDQFAEYQRSISGLPFAEIGLPERNLTMAISMASRDATAGILDDVMPGARQATSLVEDLGMGFFSRTTSKLESFNSGRTLGMTYDQAMKLNEMLGGDIFGEDFAEGGLRALRLNATGNGYANLQLEVNAKALTHEKASAMRSAILGWDEDLLPDNADELLDRFLGQRESGVPMRINVASVEGEAAQRIADAIEMTAYSSSDAHIKVPVIDHEEVFTNGRGASVVQTGPALIGNNHTASEIAGVKANATEAKNLTIDLRAQSHSSGFARAARNKKIRNRAARGDTAQTAADLIFEDYGRVEYREAKEAIGRTVKGVFNAGGDWLAANDIVSSGEAGAKMLKRASIPVMFAGALGIYAARKSRETSKYDETFEMGDTDTNGYYSGGGDFSSADALHNRVRPRVSPLATANLVFDQYDNRIGHTRPPGR